MNNKIHQVLLEDGYEVINANGKIMVYRNNWEDVIRNERYLGDRVVLMLLQKIESLESRPTCGVEQRKLLDEIEKRHELEEIGDIQQILLYDEEANHDDMISVINNVSVPGIDLEKVVQGL